jgi:hypothetical protein
LLLHTFFVLRSKVIRLKFHSIHSLLIKSGNFRSDFSAVNRRKIAAGAPHPVAYAPFPVAYAPFPVAYAPLPFKRLLVAE